MRLPFVGRKEFNELLEKARKDGHDLVNKVYTLEKRIGTLNDVLKFTGVDYKYVDYYDKTLEEAGYTLVDCERGLFCSGCLYVRARKTKTAKKAKSAKKKVKAKKR